jgi:crotonobetaine/carnitine-CoA ligase
VITPAALGRPETIASVLTLANCHGVEMNLADQRLCPLPPMEERLLSSMLLRAEAATPDAPALMFAQSGTSWTYGEFAVAGRRAAGGLRELGIIGGDRFGIMLANCPEYLVAWYGSLFAGAVDVAINHGLVGEMLAHELNVASVKAVVCDGDGARSLQAVAHLVPTLELLISLEGAPARPTGPLPIVAFDDVVVGAELSDPATDPLELVSIRYTSGTTGHPKAVGMRHSHMAAFSRHCNWLMGMGGEDRLYTCYPLHHTFASMLGVVCSFQVGACCIVDERFSGSRYWEQIRRFEATRAQIIYPLIPILMAQPASPLDREHRCPKLWTGFSMPEFEERFATRLIPHYAMSEGCIMVYDMPDQENDRGAAGKVSPLFDVQVCDDHGMPLPTGEEGEILWRPRIPGLMMAEYVGNPRVTVDSWRDLWFHSGDRGRFDKDGYMFFLGRTSEAIRRKGVNIPIASVEEAAKKMDGVVEAVAIAVPSVLGESEVKLCVVCEGDPPEATDLAAFLRTQLPPEFIPRYLEFRDDVPRTTTFKILRRELQQEGDHGITAATVDLEASRRARRTA